MESLRRPALLAAVAAALLVLNVVLLTGDDDAPADTVDAQADDGDATSDGDDGAAAQDDDDPATDEPSPDDEPEDDAASEDDEAGTEDDGPSADGTLAAPATGTYTYASSGTWSLTGDDAVEYDLPATATATVTGGDTWSIELVAGDRYADTFTFDLAADGGLDWTAWVLERQFGERQPSQTAYACSGDSAWYRPDEQGRVLQHVCQGPGITSSGAVEHLGTEDVTLGDGTVVAADRLQYAYTVTGDGVTGEGQLDLWLDPATGLRVREQRTISTTSGTTGQEYREDVVFTLQSLDPA